MERIPRLGLYLLQLESDRTNGAKDQVTIAEIVGGEARRWDGDQPSLFVVAPGQPLGTTRAPGHAPRAVVIVNAHPCGGYGV
jgi:hypothetical protein